MDDPSVKIRQRAYEIWELENRPEGKHLEHWLTAEAEIGPKQASPPDQPEALGSGQPDPGGSTAAGSQAAGGPKGRS